MSEKSYDADFLEPLEGGSNVKPVDVDKRHPNAATPEAMMQELQGEFADRHAGDAPKKRDEPNRDQSLVG
ncbi:MAG: hypothetical protein WC794_00895 [Candidatus Doudnabacteria bacterium]|jgi:hypothetical protein